MGGTPAHNGDNDPDFRYLKGLQVAEGWSDLCDNKEEHKKRSDYGAGQLGAKHLGPR